VHYLPVVAAAPAADRRLTLDVAGAMLDTTMAQALTVLELSERCGEPAERLRTWRAAGLIGSEGPDLFVPEDLQRIRLIQFLLRRGFALDAIAQANRDAGLVTSYAELLSSTERTYSRSHSWTWRASRP
jgi:hypothetical protein